MTTDLEALAVRVEALTGPDAVTGAQIICALRGFNFRFVESRGTDLNPAAIDICAEEDGKSFSFWANDPTASLDAAMTLLPEGYAIDNWYVGSDKSSCLDLLWVGEDKRRVIRANADTPCNALAAASLRALSQSKGLSNG